MSSRKTSGEVWFRIEKDSSGYPQSMDWETLAAESADNGFRLTSIPFYVRGVSWGDLVDVADTKSDVLEFSRVLERSGHSTLRLLLSEDEALRHEQVIASLRERGYLVDADSNSLLAISIPPSLTLSEELDYLQTQRAKGRWQIQAGFLSA